MPEVPDDSNQVRAVNATEPLRRHALVTPDAAAWVRADGVPLTYLALDRAVDALAHRLRAADLRSGTTVALFVRIPLRFCVAALALARLGVAFAPEMPAGRLASVALVDGEDPRAAEYARALPLVDLLPEESHVAAHAPPPMHPDPDAVLMYCPTSGTTGRPRYTPVSHELMLRRIVLRVLTLAPLSGTRSLATTRQACLVAPGSCYGFSTVLRALWGGGTVVQLGLDAGSIAERIADAGVTSLVASPIGVQRIAEALSRSTPIPGLEILEVGGGVLPAGLAALAQQRLCRNVVVAYGASETGPVTSAPLARAGARPGAAGYPYLGVTIEIVDDGDRPVAPGVEGHVRIRSEYAAGLYVDDPEASARVFRDGWVYPGDVGVLEADGMLRIVGRSDDVIDHGGVPVQPQAIERALADLADLTEVAVFGVADGARVTRLCAAVVPAGPWDAQAFHARCRERLGGDAPDVIVQVQALPRNANGKVLRPELVRLVQSLEAPASGPH